MRDRVERLVGSGAAGGMWLLTFHSMCARLLRREHQHLGVPSAFTIYDDGDTERLISGIVRDLDIDPKRFPPKAMAAAIGHAKDQVIDADAFGELASNFYEEMIAKVYRAYETRKKEAGRARLRRSDHRDGAAVPRPPRRAAALPGTVPLSAGGRVPGHEPRAVRAGEQARRPLSQRLRGRRRRPGRVLVARRHDPEPARLRARLSRRDRVRDGAELPLDRQHPGRRQRGDRAQRPAQAQGAVDRSRARRARDHLPRQRRARGGDVRRLGDRAAARRRGLPLSGCRGLLPDERDVPCRRGHLHARGHALPRVRRRAVLPAPRDQGRARATCGCCSTRRT